MPPKHRGEATPQRLKEEGNQAFLNGDYKKAIDLYSNAIGISSQSNKAMDENSIFYNNRSQAYLYMDDLEAALEDCNKALQLNPTYCKAQNNKAQILYEMGYLKEAIEWLRSLNSNEAELLLNQFIQGTIIACLESGELDRQQNLLEWLRNGKAIFPKLKIECYNLEYRGVNARSTIEQKELVMYIPRSHLITLEMAKDTEISKKILQHRVDLLSPKHSYLSTFLLQEKGKLDSFWKPYLDILPKSYATFPIFYDKDDLEWLRGSPFLKQIKEKIQDLQKDYHDICCVAQEFNNFTFQEFCWARMTASSRIFGINIKGVKTDAFVPLADMLNHKRPKLTSWCYSDEKQGFIIETDEKIEKGQVIYDSYGRKCNSRFLLNYGFVVEDNEANEVSVCVQSNPDDPLLQIKEHYVRDSLTVKTFRLVTDVEENIINEFFSHLRYLCIKEEAILHQTYRKAQYHRSTKTLPISLINELDMWQYIQQLLKQQLKEYQTTYEQDIQILNTQELSINQRNCVILRMGEKEILNFYVSMSIKMIALLNNTQDWQQFQDDDDNYKYVPYLQKIANLI